jgi:site-specific DNA-methyltransferase (adenine-specific)
LAAKISERKISMKPRSVAFNMDCIEIMKLCPDNNFDLAVVDPPYGLEKNGAQGGGKLKDRAFNRGEIKKWDIPPSDEYFKELFRISKNQIIWGG